MHVRGLWTITNRGWGYLPPSWSNSRKPIRASCTTQTQHITVIGIVLCVTPVKDIDASTIQHTNIIFQEPCRMHLQAWIPGTIPIVPVPCCFRVTAYRVGLPGSSQVAGDPAFRCFPGNVGHLNISDGLRNRGDNSGIMSSCERWSSCQWDTVFRTKLD